MTSDAVIMSSSSLFHQCNDDTGDSWIIAVVRLAAIENCDNQSFCLWIEINILTVQQLVCPASLFQSFRTLGIRVKPWFWAHLSQKHRAKHTTNTFRFDLRLKFRRTSVSQKYRAKQTTNTDYGFNGGKMAVWSMRQGDGAIHSISCMLVMLELGSLGLCQLDREASEAASQILRLQCLQGQTSEYYLN